MHPQITLDDGRTFTNLTQLFDRGLKVAGPNAPYIGYRPTVSTNPLKFADRFVWSTWGDVAKRRLDVGSGIENLFRSGDALEANGLGTVGLWSANTPGESLFRMFHNHPAAHPRTRCPRRMADYRPRPLLVRKSPRASIRKFWSGFNRYVRYVRALLIISSQPYQEYM